MHIITNPSTGEGRNVSFETNASYVSFAYDNNSTTFNNSTFISNHEKLPWAWEEEQANRIHDDDDEEGDIDGHQVDSLDTENGDRVQEIQRLERALRSAGIA
ncbi:hypothetical protein D6C76_01551 [Aureobasidium pullulans]|nr:hypothetical protein D6C76_01551 [Aureobasidium pullulans]